MITQLLGTEQRSAIERWCRDRARAVPMPHGRTLCRMLGEFPMVVSLEDLEIAPHLALDGYWEMWNSICLAKRLRRGWKAIDVGANVGYFSVLIAKLTGAPVEAWEPALDVTAMLRDTLSMNGLRDQVTIMEAAAGAERGFAHLAREEKSWGSSHIDRAHDRTGADMPVFRLDEKTMIGEVDFIKIDAEGYEPELWQGMRGLLERGEPKAMLLEWSPKKYADPEKFLAEIRAQFTVQVVDGTGDVKPPTGDLLEADGHVDLWLERPA